MIGTSRKTYHIDGNFQNAHFILADFCSSGQGLKRPLYLVCLLFENLKGVIKDHQKIFLVVLDDPFRFSNNKMTIYSGRLIMADFQRSLVLGGLVLRAASRRPIYVVPKIDVYYITLIISSNFIKFSGPGFAFIPVLKEAGSRSLVSSKCYDIFLLITH